MPDIRYSYDAVPTLRSFANDDTFFRAIIGPVGSGKSAGSTIEIVRRAMAQKPSPDGKKHTRWVVIRNTFPQLKDTTIPTFFQWLPPHLFGKFNQTHHNYVIEGLPGCQVEVMFRAMDKPDDVANLLSLEVTGAWMNEMRELPWAIVDALQTRIGRWPPMRDGGPTWFGMWGDTNPPDTDSKFYKFFEETKLDPDFAKLFKQPSGLAVNAENIPNLPGGRGYYERLCQGKSQEWINVYVKAEYGFVSDNKPIYPEYSDALHLKPLNPVPGRPIIRGWDVGFGGGCVLTQMLPDGRWLVFDELEPDGVGIDRFTDKVLEHCAMSFERGVVFEDYGDPAGQSRAQTDERSCFEIMRSKGINVEPGEQTPIIRLESVRKPMRSIVNGEAQFVLHPRCRRLRKGFMGGYHYRRMQTSGERYTDKPNKNEYAGVHDALQYPATAIFSNALTGSRVVDDYPTSPYRSDTGRSSVTGY